MLYPANGYEIVDAGYPLGVQNVSDNIGVTGVQYYINGTTATSVITSAPNYLYSYYPFQANHGDDATLTIKAAISDAAGNVGYTPEVVVTTAFPPTLTITAPSNNATVSGNLTVTATATDPTGLDGIALQIGNDITYLDDFQTNTSPFSQVFDTTRFPEGMQIGVEAAAWDTDMRRSTAYCVVTINNITSNYPEVEIQTPNITIDEPTYVHALVYSPSSAATVQFKVNGSNYGTTLTPSTNNSVVQKEFDPADFGVGTHTVTAVATNSSGSTTSPTMILTVDDTNSLPSPSYPDVNVKFDSWASGIGYVTFGQAFKKGRITSSQFGNLIGTHGANKYPVEVDNVNTYEDGSLRFACLTMAKPTGYVDNDNVKISYDNTVSRPATASYTMTDDLAVSVRQWRSRIRGIQFTGSAATGDVIDIVATVSGTPTTIATITVTSGMAGGPGVHNTGWMAQLANQLARHATYTICHQPINPPADIHTNSGAIFANPSGWPASGTAAGWLGLNNSQNTDNSFAIWRRRPSSGNPVDFTIAVNITPAGGSTLAATEIMTVTPANETTWTASYTSAATWKTWIDNDLVKEVWKRGTLLDGSSNPHPFLRPYFCLKKDKDGNIIDRWMVMEYCDGQCANPELLWYDATITADSGAVSVTRTNIMHEKHARWRWQWKKPARRFPDRTELMTSGMFPNFHKTWDQSWGTAQRNEGQECVNGYNDFAWADRENYPLHAGYLNWGGAAGSGRARGPVYTDDGWWLVTGNADAYDCFMAWAELKIPCIVHHVRDETSAAGAGQWEVWNARGVNWKWTVGKPTGPRGANGSAGPPEWSDNKTTYTQMASVGELASFYSITMPPSHSCNLGQLAYVCTGDMFFLEECLFQAQAYGTSFILGNENSLNGDGSAFNRVSPSTLNGVRTRGYKTMRYVGARLIVPDSHYHANPIDQTLWDAAEETRASAFRNFVGWQGNPSILYTIPRGKTFPLACFLWGSVGENWSGTYVLHAKQQTWMNGFCFEALGWGLKAGIEYLRPAFEVLSTFQISAWKEFDDRAGPSNDGWIANGYIQFAAGEVLSTAKGLPYRNWQDMYDATINDIPVLSYYPCPLTFAQACGQDPPDYTVSWLLGEYSYGHLAGTAISFGPLSKNSTLREIAKTYADTYWTVAGDENPRTSGNAPQTPRWSITRMDEDPR